ncbi:hypothetical protein I6M96_09150 [Acinetobacter seifertii]|uniref:glycosyltransferase family 2 protein n=1 Tax=Acinetobacter seifertii TaxID=1530123 RepID=UPI001900D75D|nr:hypothetical protein [Acinetobacter seifertii]MBJ8505170.1 hypothetical protein [Acinetobacter seifertii]
MKIFIKSLLKPAYYFFWKTYIVIMGYIFKSKITNGYDIPIIINNRNRLTFLKKLIDSLEIKGYKNIFIIDNNSDYPPLLSYYESCSYKVFRLNENVGYLALWKTDIYKKFIKDFYVYTDSDVVPTESCPNNFLDQFLKVMQSDKKLMKIGLSLNIDDLPDYFLMKQQVIDWESQYWQNEADDNRFYISNVDTTFALYRPFVKGGASRLKMYRSKKPFSAYHMPWYNDSSNLTEEEKFYIQSANTSTHWTKK